MVVFPRVRGTKKSARWVSKLLMDDMQKERVRMSVAFLVKVCCHSIVMLENIVTMEESAVLFHTPKTKVQSKQWLPKGQPDPVKAKVLATMNKQMVLAFFEFKGLIYTSLVP